MTAIPDNLVITKESAQVTIGLTGTQENWTKALTTITPPKTTANQSLANGKNDTKFVDLLLKAEERITVDGYIVTSLGTNKDINGDIINDCTDIKDTFKAIFFCGGTFNITINGTTYEVNADKVDIRWSANDKSTITSYDVKFTVIVGVDM